MEDFVQGTDVWRLIAVSPNDTVSFLLGSSTNVYVYVLIAKILFRFLQFLDGCNCTSLSKKGKTFFKLYLMRQIEAWLDIIETSFRRDLYQKSILSR